MFVVNSAALRLYLTTRGQTNRSRGAQDFQQAIIFKNVAKLLTINP